MKRLLLLQIILVSIVSVAQNLDDFSVKYSNSITIKIQKKYATNANITPNIKTNVNGIAVSGNVVLHDETSLVRLIACGDDDSEYLVFEAFNWAHQSSNVTFDNFALETELIKPTILKNIKVVVVNAEFMLNRIAYSLPDKDSDTDQSINFRIKERLRRYFLYMARQWNEHNKISGGIWIADTTSLSSLTYSQKKTIFNATDDKFSTYGLEYYVAGYFVFPSDKVNNTTQIKQSVTSQYVDHFDWRNRHGKNWMTSVKNQIDPYDDINGNGGCWAFAAVGTVEAYTNLYFNRKLNLDLSEQEMGVCSHAGTLHGGGDEHSAINWIKNNGVVNESCFPWQNNQTIPCSNICDHPSEHIQISSIGNYIYNVGNDIYKYNLINHGPLASSFTNGHTNHALVLCGYGTIHAGDSVHYVSAYQNPHVAPTYIGISEDSEYVGMTYWIFKNSYGINNSGDVDGYYYAIMESNKNFYATPITGNVTSLNYSTSDIAVTDEDNDGYYFWGLGNKPSHCPVCCPDTPDGDDSNPNIAEMNQYGQFANYVFPYDTIYVNSSRTLSVDSTYCGNLVIQNDATLTITGNLTMNPAAKIYVRGNGKLVVNGGSIINSAIDVKSSGKLLLLNSGKLEQHRFGYLNVETGATADLNYGEIVMI